MKSATFGTSVAALRLQSMVEKSPLARRKISSLLSELTYDLTEVTKIKDPRTVRLCMSLLRDNAIRKLDSRTGLTKDQKSFTKNLICRTYRAYSHGFEWVNLTLEKVGSR